MQSLLIVFSNKLPNASPAIRDRLIGFGVDLLVFEGSPEPFDKYVVDYPALAVHADLDVV
jgi:hypothetical protein